MATFQKEFRDCCGNIAYRYMNLHQKSKITRYGNEIVDVGIPLPMGVSVDVHTLHV